MQWAVGAEKDAAVFHLFDDDFRKIGGILWPTDFDELIRTPFDLHAHRWQMLGLDLNRGLRQSDFTMAGFKGRAAKPAAPLSMQ